MPSPQVCMPTLQCKSRLATGCFLFMWCGALVYKRHTEVLALAVFLAVWFDTADLSLGDPPGRVNYSVAPPPKASELGTMWDRCLKLSATQRASSHGEALYRPLSFCSQRPVFHLSLLLLISSSPLKGVSVSRRQFLLSISSDSGAEVTLFKDGLGSEFKDLGQASYLLLPDRLFIPHFLTS